MGKLTGTFVFGFCRIEQFCIKLFSVNDMEDDDVHFAVFGGSPILSKELGQKVDNPAKITNSMTNITLFAQTLVILLKELEK